MDSAETLSPLETDFFIGLVQVERSGTKKLKDYFKDKLAQFKTQSLHLAKRLDHERSLTDVERAIFYSSWQYSAIRLTCSIGNGKTIDDIIEGFQLPRDRVVDILRFLVQTGLCLEANGVYTMGVQRTHIEFGSPFLLKHHANWRLKAIQRSELLSNEEVMYTAPFSISRSDFSNIRESFVAMIKASSEKIKDSKAENIACMNLDLFWIK